jgi:hypothetical protein
MKVYHQSSPADRSLIEFLSFPLCSNLWQDELESQSIWERRLLYHCNLFTIVVSVTAFVASRLLTAVALILCSLTCRQIHTHSLEINVPALESSWRQQNCWYVPVFHMLNYQMWLSALEKWVSRGTPKSLCGLCCTLSTEQLGKSSFWRLGSTPHDSGTGRPKVLPSILFRELQQLPYVSLFHLFTQLRGIP